MDRSIFERFFSIGDVSVGPTICSLHTDGDWLGTVKVYANKPEFFLQDKFTVVGVREFNNTITVDLYNALKYLSIDKTEFDRFINQIYLFEWEMTSEQPKPDVSNLKRRAYI